MYELIPVNATYELIPAESVPQKQTAESGDGGRFSAVGEELELNAIDSAGWKFRTPDWHTLLLGFQALRDIPMNLYSKQNLGCFFWSVWSFWSIWSSFTQNTWQNTQYIESHTKCYVVQTDQLGQEDQKKIKKLPTFCLLFSRRDVRNAPFHSSHIVRSAFQRIRCGLVFEKNNINIKRILAVNFWTSVQKIIVVAS